MQPAQIVSPQGHLLRIPPRCSPSQGGKCSQTSTAKHGNLKKPHEASAQRNLFCHFETTPHPSPGFCPKPQHARPYQTPGSLHRQPHTAQYYNIIDDVDDQSIANVFCFGAFADKISGVVYNDCTGKFPYMSLDGNVCFFVLCHYKTNAILATPIPGLNFASILDAYKKNFEYLESNGCKPKLSWIIRPQK